MSWNDPKVVKAVDSLTDAQPISFKFINPEVQLGPVIGAFIEDILNINKEVIYQVAFNFLDLETKNTLLDFQLTRRKKLKAKIEEAQST